MRLFCTERTFRREVTLLIQPKFLSLSDLLANRLFRIPQYQRSYSWETKHREDMLQDIRVLRSHTWAEVGISDDPHRKALCPMSRR